jgi:hypothetical protein
MSSTFIRVDDCSDDERVHLVNLDHVIDALLEWHLASARLQKGWAIRITCSDQSSILIEHPRFSGFSTSREALFGLKDLLDGAVTFNG